MPPRGRQPDKPPPRRAPRHGPPDRTPAVQGGPDPAAVGAAVAEALGMQAPRRPRVLEKFARQGGGMEPTLGSVLSFAPAHPGWSVLINFEDGRQVIEPVIGWATVVIWTAYGQEPPNEDPSSKDTKQFQTEVQPLSMSTDGVAEVPLLREDVESYALTMPGMVPLLVPTSDNTE